MPSFFYSYHYGYNRVFFVSLKVGGKEFMGNGHTQLSARQNAAIKGKQVIPNIYVLFTILQTGKDSSILRSYWPKSLLCHAYKLDLVSPGVRDVGPTGQSLIRDSWD